MDIGCEKKRGITPQKAVKILEKYGTKITIEEAEIILEFMYKMSKLTVDNYLKAKSKTVLNK